MLTLSASFTDVYGNTHTDAVFEIGYASKSTNLVETLLAVGQVNQYTTVSCQYKFWHSAEAKSNGLPAMLLATVLGGTSFDIYPTTPEEVVDLETYCMNHLKTVVLPSIDQNVVIAE